MNNFGTYLTPEQAADFAIKSGDTRPKDQLIKYFTKEAKINKVCMVCLERAWNYAGCGLCFSCTTGESDASKDCELRR